MTEALVCAVDVGTGSARAGLFDPRGVLIARADCPIALLTPEPGHGAHSSEQIWRAVTYAVRDAVKHAAVTPQAVRGIGFDATCSLVVRARDGGPLPVSSAEANAVAGADVWDTIAWFDHRALAEAQECTTSAAEAVAYVGGTMSPEMQTPKLMWLKRHRPEIWRAAGAIYDLADYLTFRASGSNARSQATLACKWAYLPAHELPWQRAFLGRVGLADLADRAALPAFAVAVGADLGPLSPSAAADLGLTDECRVAAGQVDGFAGALGVLGGIAGITDRDPGVGATGHELHAALIAGTSSCVMLMAPEPELLPGVWGPYPDVVLPGGWVSEAGQSATGALLDHFIRLHGLQADTATHGRITSRIALLREKEGEAFARDLHVLPDFNGNRAPLADPAAFGTIAGLTLDASFDALCRLYWRGAVGIALGVRHIVETLATQGRRISYLHVAGGHLKNPLLMELYADAVGVTVLEAGSDDAVLLGAAMASATAAGIYPDLASSAKSMSHPAKVRPQKHPGRYERDYRIFLELQKQRKIIATM